MCNVDVADVFTGKRSARWVLGFVERCFVHPLAVTKAVLNGGPEHWHEWFGWSATTSRVLQQTNIALAIAGSKATVDAPSSGEPVDLDDAFARLMSR